MAFGVGIGIGQIVGLVRETRRFETSQPQIAVSGAGASELALALTADGDSDAVTVGSEPSQAVVAIMLIDDEPSAAETAVLRRLARAGTELIAVHRGAGQRIPYVLPSNVYEAGAELPIADLVRALVRLAADNGPALAARLPILRPEVERRLIARTALANAAIAASTKVRQDLPLITLAQSRMLLLLGLSRGNVLPHDPQELAMAAGPAVVGSVGIGLGARTLVRRLPVSGRLVRAGVAYAGTQALGEARLRL